MPQVIMLERCSPPGPLKREEMASRRIDGAFCLLSGEMTLGEFCEEHDLEYPQDNQEFALRPASPDEAGLFYSELEPEKDEARLPERAMYYADLEALGRRHEDRHPGLFIGSCYVAYPPGPVPPRYTGQTGWRWP